MITNCMFFKAQDPDHAKEVHIGPITLTLQQLYISIVSTLIVFPPSLTIVTIFRKVRFIYFYLIHSQLHNIHRVPDKRQSYRILL